MDHTLLISIGGSAVTLMLMIIGFFLKRLLSQFDELLKKFDEVKDILSEHKSDVEVIKEQVHTHGRDINSMNILFDRVRSLENDVTGVKVRVGMQ